MDMLRHPTILRNFLILIVTYCVIGTNYYMIGFYMKYVKGDFFVLLILSGISILISFIVTPFIT